MKYQGDIYTGKFKSLGKLDKFLIHVYMYINVYICKFPKLSKEVKENLSEPFAYPHENNDTIIVIRINQVSISQRKYQPFIVLHNPKQM